MGSVPEKPDHLLFVTVVVIGLVLGSRASKSETPTEFAGDLSPGVSSREYSGQYSVEVLFSRGTKKYLALR